MINYLIEFFFKVLNIITSKIPTTTLDFTNEFNGFFGFLRPFYHIAPITFNAIGDILKLSAINFFIAIILLIILRVTRIK